jgi:uncharacterized integral membrane protein
MGALFIRVILPILIIVLYVFALIDAIRVPEDSMYRSGNKLIWVIVILLAPLVGSIIYFLIGAPQPPQTPRRTNRPPPDDII